MQWYAKEDISALQNGGHSNLPTRSPELHTYLDIKLLLLRMASTTNGCEHDRFMTYCQAQEHGGQVRKDEQGR